MSQQNPNLIMIQAICGLFINRRIAEPVGRLDGTVENMLAKVKGPSQTGEGSESDIFQALKITVDWLRTTPKTNTVALVDLTERIRLNSGFATLYVECLERLLNEKILEEEDFYLGERVKAICSELEHAYKAINIQATIAKAHRAISFGGEEVDLTETIELLQKDLETIGQDRKDPLEDNAGRVNFADPESIIQCFDKSKESISTEGVLRTGLQGLNKMWGIGGYIRGGSYNYGALTHNYKSGMLLDHCRWLPVYNKPIMWDKNKKPMFLRLSFENMPEQDLPVMYKCIWEAEQQKELDLAEVDSREAAKYIYDKLSVNGYHFEILCFDPNKMSVWSIIEILQGFEAQGYEIHGVIIDYLELLTKGGGNTMRSDEKITYAFEVLRNHCFARGITQINAHQLSTEAQNISREGTANFAEKCSKGGWYMNCKSLHTKLDGECILHIHEMNGEDYLTFARGKNRTHHTTPARHKKFAYKFERYGGIVDDFHEEKSNAIYEWSSVSSIDSAVGDDDDFGF